MSTIIKKKTLRRNINSALERSLEKGRSYIVWEVHEDWEIKYLNSHYTIKLEKYEIDRNSFPNDFDVKKCKSKIVCEIYGMKGRYIKRSLDKAQVSALKKEGLKIRPCLYIIYNHNFF